MATAREQAEEERGDHSHGESDHKGREDKGGGGTSGRLHATADERNQPAERGRADERTRAAGVGA